MKWVRVHTYAYIRELLGKARSNFELIDFINITIQLPYLSRAKAKQN